MHVLWVVLALLLLTVHPTSSRKKKGDTDMDKDTELKGLLHGEDSVRAKALVDFLLESMTANIEENNLQPLPIPDTTHRLGRRILGARWTSSVKLYNGEVVNGLQTAMRTAGDKVRLFLLNSESTSRHLRRRLSFEFELSDVRLRTNASVKLAGLGPNCQFEVKSEQMKLAADLLIDFTLHHRTSLSGSTTVDIRPSTMLVERILLRNHKPLDFRMRGSWSWAGSWKVWRQLMAPVARHFYNTVVIKSIERVLNEMLMQAIQETGVDAKSNKRLTKLLLKLLKIKST